MCQGWVRWTNMILPSYGTSSSHWPGGTWTEPRGLSCRAETKQANDKSAVFINYYPFFHFLSLFVLSTSPQSSPPPLPITCNCFNFWMTKYEQVIQVSCTAINRNRYPEVMCMRVCVMKQWESANLLNCTMRNRETSQLAHDMALSITMTRMTENFHQQLKIHLKQFTVFRSTLKYHLKYCWITIFFSKQWSWTSLHLFWA